MEEIFCKTWLAESDRRSEQPPAVVERKPRGPSISKIIAQAEKATGKPVTSITMPDGTKLDFSKPESAEPKNPWPLDEFHTKETKR